MVAKRGGGLARAGKDVVDVLEGVARWQSLGVGDCAFVFPQVEEPRADFVAVVHVHEFFTFSDACNPTETVFNLNR